MLSAIIAGASLSDIASRLGLELTDVKHLRECAMRKIGANSTADAVRIGIYAGLGD